MNQREKLLVGIVATVAVLLVGRLFYSSYAAGLSKLKNDVAKAEKDRQEADLKLKMARDGQRKLAAWKGQSLPDGNPTRAYQLYYNWLYDTMEKSGIKPEKLTRLTTPVLSSNISTIGLDAQTKGDLPDLVDFMYKFYSSPQLHQITRLELTPEPGGLKLKTIKLQIEALILPDTSSNPVPPVGKVNSFKLADAGDYRTAIDRRNIFKPYRPPTEPIVDRGIGPRAEDPLDESRFAKFSGTNLGNKGLVAWIYRMNTGATMFVAEGDAVNVGSWKGKVVAVEPRSLVLERDGKRTRVEIGRLIKDGKPEATPPAPAAQSRAAEGDAAKSTTEQESTNG